MGKRSILAAAIAAAMGIGGVAATSTAVADGFFDMMNPFEWFFDDDDDWDDWRYGYGPHGWGGPYGWGGPHGWGGPYAHHGMSAPQTIVVYTPGSSNQAESTYPE